MTESDFFPFMDVFRSVMRVFPMRGDDHEIKQTAGAYFKVLRRYPLPLVQAGADQCLQRCKHFPKPAEWIDHIPNPQTTGVQLPTMSSEQGHDHARAVNLFYEDDPCRCPECRAAGVDHRPLRFVPEFDAADLEVKALNPVTGKIVTCGHWAHGVELKRWYAARQGFIETCETLGLSFGSLGIGKPLSNDLEVRRLIARKNRQRYMARLIPRSQKDIEPEPEPVG